MLSVAQSSSAGDTASAELQCAARASGRACVSWEKTLSRAAQRDCIWLCIAPCFPVLAAGWVGESALRAGEGRSISAKAAAVTKVSLPLQHPWQCYCSFYLSFFPVKRTFC